MRAKTALAIVPPEDRESLAAIAQQVSDSLGKLLKSGLTRKAVTVLVHDDTKISKRDIDTVMVSLLSLAQNYTTI